jgi:hypothetical protein
VTFLGFVGDTVIHQNRNTDALRLRNDLHKVFEKVKG